ncbi:2242_t:CDS:2 [Racocetra persica]|uniref:2242_t:CDS:1 n=1 Tax=Racocetra persica TaxID=160502 RepID=A0ACA9RDE4_9GLOM|nr:2242_t:CDS:2 [Racocetra persica]
MIKSFGDKETERLFKKEFVAKFQKIAKVTYRKLKMLNNAERLEDLDFPSNRFRKMLGEILREELLIPLNISGEKLAQELKVDKKIVEEIIGEKRNITPDIALRLSCYFPQSAQF